MIDHSEFNLPEQMLAEHVLHMDPALFVISSRYAAMGAMLEAMINTGEVQEGHTITVLQQMYKEDRERWGDDIDPVHLMLGALTSLLSALTIVLQSDVEAGGPHEGHENCLLVAVANMMRDQCIRYGEPVTVEACVNNFLSDLPE